MINQIVGGRKGRNAFAMIRFSEFSRYPSMPNAHRKKENVTENREKKTREKNRNKKMSQEMISVLRFPLSRNPLLMIIQIPPTPPPSRQMQMVHTTPSAAAPAGALLRKSTPTAAQVHVPVTHRPRNKQSRPRLFSGTRTPTRRRRLQAHGRPRRG